MKDELMTSAEVAREAGVVPATVRFWETAGKLPAKRTMSGQRVFLRGDVDRFLRARAEKKAARVPA